MSGRGGRDHGVYNYHGHGHGNGHLTLGRTDLPFNDDDMENFFFQRPSGGGGDDDIIPYSSSFTDYLQGFLDQPGLARDLDVPCPAQDASVKHELSVDVSYDSRARGATGSGVTPITPNSSLSASSSEADGEGGKLRRCKKGRPKAEEEEEEVVVEGEGEEKGGDGENSEKA